MSENHLQKYEGVKTLVFGSTGFIGRWVARKLCAAGAKVSLPVRRMAAAQNIFTDYGINGDIYDLDLRNDNAARDLIQKVCPTITFNLAGYGVKRAEQSDHMAYRINALLVESLCSSIAEIRDSSWPGQDIIHVGTAMEYGAISGDLKEDSEPDPTTLYGKSKLEGTLRLTANCRHFGLKGLTARLFAVYGAGESSVRLLPTLIRAVKTREPIALTAGLHERDFIYVEDAAEGLLRLGLASANKGEVVNLATGLLTSIRGFTETAAEVLGISAERLKFGALPTRPEEMKNGPVANERLRELTGWIPNTIIAEGVRKTVSFGQTGTVGTSGRGI